MTKRLIFALPLILVGYAEGVAAAQMSAPPIPSALPDVRSISPANAAGVLQYCLKNSLVSSAATDALLAPLAGKKDITSSPNYSAGQAGTIIAGGKNFSIANANDYLKSQACDMVFNRAKQFK